ncbi:MAG: amino acid ABC transporter ATP-binding protein, partial [Peptostreptococcus sp.]|nr:amino acid ABC transporter ATP-binding protein [Peptostreptococcus sp.]
ARSCALKPKVLCFDEPTSALDKENIQKVEEIIRNCKRMGMTILIITHDTVFAREIADKTLNISEGLLV